MTEWYSFANDTVAEREFRELFGAWLIESRRRLGCSQAAMGALVGVHQSTISRLESGKIRYLHFRTGIRVLVLIVEALVVPRPAGLPPRPAIHRAW